MKKTGIYAVLNIDLNGSGVMRQVVFDLVGVGLEDKAMMVAHFKEWAKKRGVTKHEMNGWDNDPGMAAAWILANQAFQFLDDGSGPFIDNDANNRRIVADVTAVLGVRQWQAWIDAKNSLVSFDLDYEPPEEKVTKRLNAITQSIFQIAA